MNRARLNKPEKIKIKFNARFISGIVLGSFAVIYLFLTLQTVASGAKLASLEKEESELTKQNKEYTLELVEASSLMKIGQKAEDLGFAKPQSTVYLSREDTVAKLP